EPDHDCGEHERLGHRVGEVALAPDDRWLARAVTRAEDQEVHGVAEQPEPEALVLTAIVIGFGVISFLLAMAYRAWTIDGNDDAEDDITDRRLADQPDEETT
ncbi:MAG: NADH-quinone oxidoreductase subunit K, partial [Actinomycetota bacterium]